MTDEIITVLALLTSLGCGWMIGVGRMTWRQYGLWLLVGGATYSTVRWGLGQSRWMAIVVGNVAVAVFDHFYERRVERTKVDRVLKLDDGRTVITFGRSVTPQQIEMFADLMRRMGH